VSVEHEPAAVDSGSIEPDARHGEKRPDRAWVRQVRTGL
jgi:hypothetical protein